MLAPPGRGQTGYNVHCQEHLACNEEGACAELTLREDSKGMGSKRENSLVGIVCKQEHIVKKSSEIRKLTQIARLGPGEPKRSVCCTNINTCMKCLSISSAKLAW